MTSLSFIFILSNIPSLLKTWTPKSEDTANGLSEVCIFYYLINIFSTAYVIIYTLLPPTLYLENIGKTCPSFELDSEDTVARRVEL